MANNIYEFGGIADILIKLKIDKEINGVTYQAGEPYTFLKDVVINFNYQQQDSLATAKTNVLSANSGRPSQIVVSNIPFTQKIADLMLTRDTTTIYNRTRREMVTCEKDGELLLSYQPNDSIVFVYDKNFNRVTVNNMHGTILYGQFVAETNYLVFYQELAAGNKYSFEIPFYPYFQADIFMKGNTNKITNGVYMHFDALSLVSVPNFNIISGGMLNTPLVFNVIYKGQPEPIIVFEE